MKRKEMIEIGISAGAMPAAFEAIKKAIKKDKKLRKKLKPLLQDVVKDPTKFLKDPVFNGFAEALIEEERRAFHPREGGPAPWTRWGDTNVDQQTIDQMAAACELPITAVGALMPDAHLGYGLPIGGVLATRNTVIPYAVGVDIACRVKMTVLDLPVSMLEEHSDALERAIERETAFGIGASFDIKPRDHEVMDEDWSITKITKNNKDRAWSQLGSSGGGNHFVEFGVIDIPAEQFDGLEGEYLALLSHSGSRGVGSAVCKEYSGIANKQHRDLPKHLKNLAWLDLDSEPGYEYWEAMNLMDRYASANHACIHRHISQYLGATVIADVESAHNLAWKEQHNGEEVIVHRKGATPAKIGNIGIIPGTMADPAFIVHGLGNKESINSASHGAGRRMSRTQAKKTFNWNDTKKYLSDRKVKLISGDLDEVPMAYKDIYEVMNDQSDLVEIMATFYPRMVKMAPPERKKWKKRNK